MNTRVVSWLALLAPEILEAILDGRQAPEMTLPVLMGVFPAEWEDQRAIPIGGTAGQPT